ncbi:hypothetical protein R3P38DRAFT_2758222 [Favolaschia claudopus]|uniref:Uncharacterized protein n=1 Tax=Favolaschia claudopus TaxID=2862362 RepID=A0AAW0ECK6_9AGAR
MPSYPTTLILRRRFRIGPGRSGRSSKTYFNAEALVTSVPAVRPVQCEEKQVRRCEGEDVQLNENGKTPEIQSVENAKEIKTAWPVQSSLVCGAARFQECEIKQIQQRHKLSDIELKRKRSQSELSRREAAKIIRKIHAKMNTMSQSINRTSIQEGVSNRRQEHNWIYWALVAICLKTGVCRILWRKEEGGERIRL